MVFRSLKLEERTYSGKEDAKGRRGLAHGGTSSRSRRGPGLCIAAGGRRDFLSPSVGLGGLAPCLVEADDASSGLGQPAPGIHGHVLPAGRQAFVAPEDEGLGLGEFFLGGQGLAELALDLE